MVKRETRRKLKCLKSNNGGEYTSRDFETYYTKNGIRHEKKVYGTPWSNGVAEMMNCTIIERVRCMLNTAKLPKVF